MAGTFAVSESADGLGSLVLEAREKLVELRDAEGLEEPFYIRARQLAESIKAQACILNQNRSLDRLRSPDRLIPRDLLNGTLNLDQIHGLRAQVDGCLGQDGLHFCELVLVARDEVEFLGRSHCRCSMKICGPSEG